MLSIGLTKGLVLRAFKKSKFPFLLQNSKTCTSC